MPTLTTIPPELRLEIYAYVLIDSSVAYFGNDGSTKPKYATALFRVNKQISEESMEFFYNRNGFVLVRWPGKPSVGFHDRSIGLVGHRNYLSIYSDKLQDLSLETSRKFVLSTAIRPLDMTATREFIPLLPVWGSHNSPAVTPLSFTDMNMFTSAFSTRQFEVLMLATRGQYVFDIIQGLQGWELTYVSVETQRHAIQPKLANRLRESLMQFPGVSYTSIKVQELLKAEPRFERVCFPSKFREALQVCGDLAAKTSELRESGHLHEAHGLCTKLSAFHGKLHFYTILDAKSEEKHQSTAVWHRLMAIRILMQLGKISKVNVSDHLMPHIT